MMLAMMLMAAGDHPHHQEHDDRPDGRREKRAEGNPFFASSSHSASESEEDERQSRRRGRKVGYRPLVEDWNPQSLTLSFSSSRDLPSLTHLLMARSPPAIQSLDARGPSFGFCSSL